MKLDNEQQRGLLLQILDHVQFPGDARKVIFELGRAIETADIDVQSNDDGTKPLSE